MAFIDLSNFHDWPMGGMLEYELALLRHLVKKFDIDIWGVSVNGVKPNPILINGKKYAINVFTNVITTQRIIPNYWRGIFIYNKRKLLKEKYDYYYAHTGSCLVGVGLFEKNAKLIYQQHGLNYFNDHSLKQLIQRPFYSKAQKDANLVFVVSDPASVKKYEDLMKNKHNIKANYISVRSPIELTNFDSHVVEKKINSNTSRLKNFIYTGRLTKFKNVECLIRVFNKYVKEVEPEAVLTVVGSGEEEKNLKEQINSLRLNKNVNLIGAVPHKDIYKLLMESDVFLTASGGEGVSVSVAEAYAAGLPVVCFKVPGLEKQVIDKVTGKIAEPSTDNAFFDAMIFVNKHYRMLAKNAVLEAKKYDSKSISDLIGKNILKL